MGTNFTIIVHGQEDAKHAIDSAFAELERVNQIFSTYDPSSEVSKLNISKKAKDASKDLLELIVFSEELSHHSLGAFDIKIGAATHLWKDAIQANAPPDSTLLQRERSKKRWITVKKSKVKIGRYTRLDFGAIAKGYAVDQAFLFLKGMGFDTLLIDGGGDIRMGEAPHESRGWKISQYYEAGKIKFMSNCAIATSGPDYQSLRTTAGKTSSHIVDPKSLEGLSGKIGVTIVAESCKLADALATTVSVTEDINLLEDHYTFKANIWKNGAWRLKQF